MLFDAAYIIASKTDLDKSTRKVIAVDLPTNCYLSKPSSGWVLSSLTNVHIKITPLPGTLVGVGILPRYLQTSKGTIGLTHKRGKEYKDKLCAFWCTALLYGSSKEGLEKYTQFLLERFEKLRGKEYKNSVRIFDMPLLEI